MAPYMYGAIQKTLNRRSRPWRFMPPCRRQRVGVTGWKPPTDVSKAESRRGVGSLNCGDAACKQPRVSPLQHRVGSERSCVRSFTANQGGTAETFRP